MAVEQYANLSQTTLNGGITNVATTIVVTSATGFPSSAPYTIRIEDEIIKVTAGAGTTSWTVTRGAEGTTNVAHSSGMAVNHVLTAGSLEQLTPAITGAATTDSILTAQASGDTQNRIQITAGGEILLGSGSAAPDTNLYWGQANTLKTDDDLWVVGSIRLGTSGDAILSRYGQYDIRLDGSAGGSSVLFQAFGHSSGGIDVGHISALSGDSIGRQFVGINTSNQGSVEFGSGSTTRDTRIYRSAANTLTIDDNAGGTSITQVINANGEWWAYKAAATNPAFLASVVGDSNPVRFTIAANGDIQWGPGGSSRDTRLRRTAAGDLTLDSISAATASRLFIESTSGQSARFLAQVAGDTNSRAILGGDATLTGLLFGPGNASTDLQVARTAATTLTIDDNASGPVTVLIGNSATTTSTFRAFGTIDARRSTTSNSVYQTRLASGDTNARFNMLADGNMNWGSGSGATDTTLYRSAADTLKTDDTFIVGASGDSALQVTDGAVKVTRSIGGYYAFIGNTGGVDRFSMTATGTISWRNSGGTTVGLLAQGASDQMVYAANGGPLEFQHRLAFGATISPAALSANTSNWNPTNLQTSNVIRIDTTTAVNLTGIVAPTNSLETFLLLTNISANTITLVHDATSTTTNRFLCPGSVNFSLTANRSVLLWYDQSGSSRWRVIG